VSDHEPPLGPGDSEPTGWLGAFLSSTPRVLGSVTALIGAVSGLIIALDKAGVIGGDSETTTTQVTTGGADAKSLFAPGPRGNGDVRFEDATMYVTAKTPRHGVRVLADQSNSLQDVELTARVKWESGADDWSFALVCRSEDSRNYYLLGVTSSGKYNIAKYRDGHLRPLTGLRPSDAIDSRENRVRVRCAGYRPTTLTLAVNGETLASIRDSNDDIESGNVGLRVGSTEDVVTCSFNDFLLTSL
jgi:hypothetical protein